MVIGVPSSTLLCFDCNAAIEQIVSLHKDASCNKGSVVLTSLNGRFLDRTDFSESSTRIIVTIGILFPPKQKNLIRAKVEYNDAESRREHHHHNKVNGMDWLKIQAKRKLCQAADKCIHHKDVWGAIIMIDSRFDNSWRNILPRWMNELIETETNIRNFVKELQTFIEKHNSQTSRSTE
uniref:Fanconi anemia group J n=1 Tax=Aceria tosichella TaxID=561515 RepID=A0A6G1SLM8_9ACAR